MSARERLKRLLELRAVFGSTAATEKRELLERLDDDRLRSARQVHGLHEVLCFLRAYPDDAAVLARVERMLETFADRADLAEHREALDGTGIAGTAIPFAFFFSTARWLADRWPDRLAIDWNVEDYVDRLRAVLPALVSTTEAMAFRESREDARALVERTCGAGEADGTGVVRRFAALGGETSTVEALHDVVDTFYILAPGPRPSRTLAHFEVGPTVYQRRPLSRERPDLRRSCRRGPRRTRLVDPETGSALIDLAREAMVTRARDLDAFAYGNPHDVTLADDGDGLVFVCIGSLPERRHLVRAAYGMVMLKNGVPIGYVQVDVALGHAEVSFNVFDTFRGAEAGRLFARALAFTRHTFDAMTFSIEPYQLGMSNKEAIDSGAWWFYYKFGFRPQDRELLELADAEIERMRADPDHRSSRATLRRLASKHVYFTLDRRRTVGPPPYPGIARAVSAMIAKRFAGDRSKAMRRSPALALRRLGLTTFGATTADERRAVARLSPLILCLPDVETWSRGERRAVAPLVRAKGGKREREFLAWLSSHARFGESLLRLDVLRGGT